MRMKAKPMRWGSVIIVGRALIVMIDLTQCNGGSTVTG